MACGGEASVENEKPTPRMESMLRQLDHLKEVDFGNGLILFNQEIVGEMGYQPEDEIRWNWSLLKNVTKLSEEEMRRRCDNTPTNDF